MKPYRSLLWASALMASAALAGEPAPPVEMTVYRSPTCGCCGKWVAQMQTQGYAIKDVVTDAVDKIKDGRGVPDNLRSCHTALVGGYVVEGHVPAADIRDLLERKPSTAGLAVPGMVVGSPGMEMGDRKAPYDVVEFDQKGGVRVAHEYRPD
ncbi:DUF411 domain-containing protein [Methylomagnum ishizawai]|uniref:DUF411 domain-containing protein n=1 Tax=Methylomagnum ishizawai TaxID=1760988 RepID=UPI001C333D5F|nr:DUF411 domain-containing protein [Methylomagnum ishizawai]BBL76738.1 copper amine oxidase [Methylomagnum ishizawai]